MHALEHAGHKPRNKGHHEGEEAAAVTAIAAAGRAFCTAAAAVVVGRSGVALRRLQHEGLESAQHCEANASVFVAQTPPKIPAIHKANFTCDENRNRGAKALIPLIQGLLSKKEVCIVMK